MQKIKHLLYCSLSLLLIINGFNAVAQNFVWTKWTGGTGMDKSRGITTDAVGNIYVTGAFQNSFDFDPGPGVTTLTSGGNSDIFVTKTDPQGNFIWAKSFKGSGLGAGMNRSYGICTDNAGNIYITGYFDEEVDFDPGNGNYKILPNGGDGISDVFVCKLDANGKFVWAINMGGGGDDAAYSICADSACNLYLTGTFSQTADFGGYSFTVDGNEDAFICKLDSAGSVLWAGALGGSDLDGGNGIALDNEGNMYIAGYYNNFVDFDPDPAPLAFFNMTTSGSIQLFVLKLKNNGKFVWAKSVEYGSSVNFSIAMDDKANIYTTGYFFSYTNFGDGVPLLASDGGEDIFIAKMDSSGNYLWAKQMGGLGDDEGYSIGVDTAGNVYGTGFFNGSADFDPSYKKFNLLSAGAMDAYVCKLNTHGTLQYAKRMGGTGDDLGQSLVATSGGNVYTVGFFNAIVDFDPGPGLFEIASAGSSDAFLQMLGNSDLAISFNTTPAACGNRTGKAEAIVTGGTPPYQYLWSTASTDSVIDSLKSGTYALTVIDNNGIKVNSVVTISDNDGPTVTANILPVKCPGESNGAVNVTVIGGASPYTFNWSTGDKTEDLINLKGGSYDLKIKDNNGCQVLETFVVPAPKPLEIYINSTLSTCGNATGSATASVFGGNPPYLYYWSTGAATPSIYNKGYGIYNVVITDSKNCKDSTYAAISEQGAPSVVIDSVMQNICGSTGSIYPIITGGTTPYSYSWSNGKTTKNLLNVLPGYYNLTVTGGNGCKAVNWAQVKGRTPSLPEICIITVDSITGTNKLIWEKGALATQNIKHFNVYREGTSVGSYIKVNTLTADSPGVYTDPIANPLTRAWRYKITAEDSCGNESEMSYYHKTIHLAVNLNQGAAGYNLIWDDYEGFPYSSVVVYRYTAEDGFMAIDTLPAGQHSYSDKPVNTTNLHYYVMVEKDYGCDPDKAGKSKSRSNIGATKQTITFPYVNNRVEAPVYVRIMPNPNDGYFNLSHNSMDKNSNFNLCIRNMLGEKVKEQLITGQSATIDMRSTANGIYFGTLISEGVIVANFKLFVQ